MKLRFASLFLVVIALGQASIGCSRPPSKTVADTVEEDPSGYEELLKLGLEFAEAQHDDRAEQYLSAALERGADPDVALAPLLASCIRAKRYQAAVQHAEAYLEQVSARRETEMVLATLYLALDEHERAKEHLEYVVENYSKYALGHYLLGTVVQEHEHDVARADRLFRTYLTLEPQGQYVALARRGLLKSVSDAETLPERHPDILHPSSLENADTEYEDE